MNEKPVENFKREYGYLYFVGRNSQQPKENIKSGDEWLHADGQWMPTMFGGSPIADGTYRRRITSGSPDKGIVPEGETVLTGDEYTRDGINWHSAQLYFGRGAGVWVSEEGNEAIAFRRRISKPVEQLSLCEKCRALKAPSPYRYCSACCNELLDGIGQPAGEWVRLSERMPLKDEYPVWAYPSISTEIPTIWNIVSNEHLKQFTHWCSIPKLVPPTLPTAEPEKSEVERCFAALVETHRNTTFFRVVTLPIIAHTLNWQKQQAKLDGEIWKEIEKIATQIDAQVVYLMTDINARRAIYSHTTKLRELEQLALKGGSVLEKSVVDSERQSLLEAGELIRKQNAELASLHVELEQAKSDRNRAGVDARRKIMEQINKPPQDAQVCECGHDKSEHSSSTTLCAHYDSYRFGDVICECKKFTPKQPLREVKDDEVEKVFKRLDKLVFRTQYRDLIRELLSRQHPRSDGLERLEKVLQDQPNLNVQRHADGYSVRDYGAVKLNIGKSLSLALDAYEQARKGEK